MMAKKSTAGQPRFQIKIKISEQHKRVFFLREEEEAYDLVEAMMKASMIWEAGQVD
jgi:hypothetical protein